MRHNCGKYEGGSKVVASSGSVFERLGFLDNGLLWKHCRSLPTKEPGDDLSQVPEQLDIPPPLISLLSNQRGEEDARVICCPIREEGRGHVTWPLVALLLRDSSRGANLRIRDNGTTCKLDR